MRDLTYYVAVSADGYIADPDDGFDAFPQHGDHIDMIFREYRDTLPGVGLDALGLTAHGSRFDTVLMGWNTYAAGFPLRDPYPHLRQYVFSRSKHGSDAAPGITVTADDPVAVVRSLKAEPTGSGIWLCGGGRLASSLVDEIDRYVLKVNPVLLGEGIPLFAPRGYSLRELLLDRSTSYDSGVVVTEYRRA